MTTDPEIIGWLLDGDPSIRWQVLQDLLDAPASRVEQARDAVGSTGWGAELLARQDPDGRWAGALYGPKWTSTTYTLLLLARLGLPSGNPAALAGCAQLWSGAAVIDDGLDLSRTARRPELCITSMVVFLTVRFGHDDSRLDDVVRGLISHQLDDGGWNCRVLDDPSRHGSFHTSVLALEALTAYRMSGGRLDVGPALGPGREFFLRHRLYRSHRTGEVAIAASTRFPFPPQWHFDVLRGLEHFAAADAPRDPRLADAVDLVRSRRRPDGRWSTYAGYPGRQWLEMETPGAGRWTTLRALRVLRWWDSRPPAG